jgi:hypothetical protein
MMNMRRTEDARMITLREIAILRSLKEILGKKERMRMLRMAERRTPRLVILWVFHCDRSLKHEEVETLASHFTFLV